MYDYNTSNELEVTVALVGQSNAGKSTLRLQSDINRLPEQADDAFGVKSFDRLEFYDEFSVRLFICDLPGREKLRPMTQSYISNADAVIIMYDITNPNAYKQTDKIIRDMQRLKGEEEYWWVLFGNKIDMQNQRAVGADKMMKLSFKYGIPLYEGSLRQELSLDKMFYSLTKQWVDELFEIEDT